MSRSPLEASLSRMKSVYSLRTFPVPNWRPNTSGTAGLQALLGELMTKIKMVKCMLRSPGEAPAVRYVPLREFQLWRYYMTHPHEKIVAGQEKSVWVDALSYSEQPPAQARPLEAALPWQR